MALERRVQRISMAFWLVSAVGFILLLVFDIRLYGLELSLPVVFMVLASRAFGFLTPPYSGIFKSVSLAALVLLIGFILAFTAVPDGQYAVGGVLLVYMVGLGYLAFVAVYLVTYLVAKPS